MKRARMRPPTSAAVLKSLRELELLFKPPPENGAAVAGSNTLTAAGKTKTARDDSTLAPDTAQRKVRP